MAQIIEQRSMNDSLWIGVESHRPQGILLVYNFLSWETGEIITNCKGPWAVASSDSTCVLRLRFRDGADLSERYRAILISLALRGRDEKPVRP